MTFRVALLYETRIFDVTDVFDGMREVDYKKAVLDTHKSRATIGFYFGDADNPALVVVKTNRAGGPLDIYLNPSLGKTSEIERALNLKDPNTVDADDGCPIEMGIVHY